MTAVEPYTFAFDTRTAMIDPLSPLSIARCARCQLPFASGEFFVSTGSKTWHNECFRIDPLSPLSIARCARCQLPFASGEFFVSTGSKTWHNECFRCAQCFCSLLDDLHFLVEGRNYCEHDFKALYAPSCAKCGDFIMGRVIKAANSSWHPQCLRCEQCSKQLENDGVWHHAGRIELNEKARIYNDQLYCPRCYDYLLKVCSACRRPIDDERSVFALGKHWHTDHFLCAKCEKPFYGSKHYEKRERAYCESCYKKHFLCAKCEKPFYGSKHYEKRERAYCESCYKKVIPIVKLFAVS
uniref:LIM domain-containing protein n=1 Tax=Ascaris lumbricoides TaxID=6252 RepID=A0A0M3I3Y5_ASCLU